ncbi:hypothetical protein GCM10023350_26640 [Nocardioides endophyticus]|uniref:DUF3108 domain-containing protein n=2 Tax=Nocardioides endophyticus TaxID=1353775 RepID=A0ABP8YY03_9ACTN
MIFGAVATLVLSLLPAVAPPPALDHSALDRSVLTPDGSSYHYRYDGDRLAVRASRGGGEPNRREVVVDQQAPVSRDQLSCATWTRQSSWRVQPGLAVRVNDTGDRVRAVTLTKNIVFGVQTVINVLTWDTARRGEPWRAVGQYDVARAVVRDGKLLRLPWRVCLRVADRRMSFKIWPIGRVDRPGWSERRYVRHARLPRSFDIAGRPGWYVGHVPGGGSAVYRDLRTR